MNSHDSLSGHDPSFCPVHCCMVARVFELSQFGARVLRWGCGDFACFVGTEDEGTWHSSYSSAYTRAHMAHRLAGAR